MKMNLNLTIEGEAAMRLLRAIVELKPAPEPPVEWIRPARSVLEPIAEETEKPQEPVKEKKCGPQHYVEMIGVAEMGGTMKKIHELCGFTTPLSRTKYHIRKLVNLGRIKKKPKRMKKASTKSKKTKIGRPKGISNWTKRETKWLATVFKNCGKSKLDPDGLDYRRFTKKFDIKRTQSQLNSRIIYMRYNKKDKRFHYRA